MKFAFVWARVDEKDTKNYTPPVTATNNPPAIQKQAQ